MKFFENAKKKSVKNNKEILKEKFKNFVLELKVRGFSEKSIDSYLYYNGAFLDFIKKEQRSVTSNDIKSYLTYLLLEGVQPRTINLAISSLKAYYEAFLGKKLFKNIKRSKIPKDMPNIISKDEITTMIDKTKNLKHKLLIESFYSSGMRSEECVKIKVENIDIKEKIVFISKGKGKKDRYTITSKRFIGDLKKFLSERKKQSIYLFDNGYGKHLSTRAAGQIVKQAAKRAGIKKRVHPHLLRACFTTHLIEKGVPIEKIQKLLGHARISTTQGYIRTRTDDLKKIKSPLD